MAVVYRHRRKDNLEVFYVGIGKDVKRAYSSKNRNKYWRNIVSKHGYDIEVVQEGLDYEIAKELEIFMIGEYGRSDLGKGCLCNMTDGGDGSVNFKHSEESKLLISKNNSRVGYWRGKNRDMTVLCKPVYYYKPSGELAGEFGSIQEASNNLNIKDSNISMVCKGKRKTAGGFIWEYKK